MVSVPLPPPATQLSLVPTRTRFEAVVIDEPPRTRLPPDASIAFSVLVAPVSVRVPSPIFWSSAAAPLSEPERAMLWPLVSNLGELSLPVPLRAMSSDEAQEAVARRVPPLPPTFTAAGPVPSLTMPPAPMLATPPATVKVPLPLALLRQLTTTVVAFMTPPVWL